MRRLHKLLPAIVALLSGAALTLAFPEPDLAPIAWIALVPLLVVTTTGTVRGAIGLGFIFGLGFFGTLLSWISLVGWLAWALLVPLQAGFVALFAGLWSWVVRAHGLIIRLAAPGVLWVVFELLRTRIPLGGFTWGQLAQSQHNLEWMLRPAAYGGAWAVGLILVTTNSLLAEAWRTFRRDQGRLAPICVLAAGALVAAPLLIPAQTAEGSALKVAIVQGNVPRDFEGNVLDKEVQIIQSHRRLTTRLAGEDLDLIVWPESSVGLDLDENEVAASAVAGAARAVRTPMIVGGNLDVGDDHYKVMAFLVGESGEIVDRYQKTHLVPFGEYVPARELLDWLPILDQVPRDAVTGHERSIFRLAKGAVAPVISYEGDFGSLVRERIDAGGRLLVVATNTSTWGESWASAQHVAFSQVRAAENGVWVIHAALSGISAFIAPDGSVAQDTPLWKATNATHAVRFAEGGTFYSRTGDWLPLLCLLVAAGLLVSTFVKRRR